MIREASFKDYKRISELSKVENNWLLQIIRNPLALLFFRALGRKTFVLEQEGKIVGFIMVQKNIGGELLVDPSERKRGYGTELRLFTERHILERYPEMIIYCAKESQSYYESQGYRFLKEENSRLGNIRMSKAY